jgi:metal-sulfur cluster biosynthetic enzyme
LAIRILTDDETALDTGTLPENTPLRDRAIHALRNVMDPELPLNIYDLGLIYGLDIDEKAQTAHLTMTLTAPNCPVAEELPKQAQSAVSQATGFPTTITLTFTPPWNKNNLPLEAKLALGLL